VIRDASPADLDALIELVHALAEYERAPQEVVLDRDEFGSHLFAGGAVARAIVAEDAGRVVGCAIYFRTFSTWLGRDGIWLEDLFVLPEARRHGYGRALLDEVRARTTGRVDWAVLDWNRPAQEFYRALGTAPLDEWTIWRWPPVASDP
jgi:GNAT superfamily N-acetyltransferase